MATATSLAQAAGQAFDNLQVRWLSSQLKNTLINFWSANLDLFPQQIQASHPVSNWLVIIAALGQVMPTGVPPITQLTDAAEAVYRLCWMASFLQGTGAISNTQALTLLASYNTIIGF